MKDRRGEEIFRFGETNNYRLMSSDYGLRLEVLRPAMAFILRGKK